MQKGLSVSYATQDPWIMNGTIKDNILMGSLFDKVFYSKIIKACGLDVDFENFVDGQYTIVGDRGVQCSGGQVSVALWMISLKYLRLANIISSSNTFVHFIKASSNRSRTSLV